MINIHRRLLLQFFFQFQIKGNHRLNAHFSGIDQADCQIFNNPGRQHRITVMNPLHVDFFFQRQFCLHTGTHTLLFRQIQHLHLQPAFQIDTVVTHTDFIHDDIPFDSNQMTGIRSVIRYIYILFQHHLGSGFAGNTVHMYLLFH